MSWKTFLKAHWGAIAATDFFSVEVLTRRGLVLYFVLFIIDLETRRVEIAGIVQQPDGEWMKQIARNLTDAEEGFLNGARYPLGERHLRTAVTEYTEHYHFERNHQGLENKLIEKPGDEPDMDGSVECQERLGGVLEYYYRRAA